MKTIRCTTKTKSYDMLVAGGFLGSCGRLIATAVPPCRACLVTDETVETLYAEPVQRALEESGFEVCRFVFPGGEAHKTMDTVADILEFLSRSRLQREDLVVALGGGIVGDVAGFAAACYLRGIRCVQLPTTLLAAVDSSVGGKTGVNLAAGKNLAGAFWQPELVLCDTDTLRTLPRSQWSDGVAEAVKAAMLCDPELLGALTAGRYDLEDVIARCAGYKARVVAADERESGERRLLNFGHTVGHAVEKLSDYRVPHGHAVAIGMAVMTRAAEKIGFTKEPCLDRLLAALEANGLPAGCEYTAAELTAASLADKKRAGDTITLVLPRRVGECALAAIGADKLQDILRIGNGR